MKASLLFLLFLFAFLSRLDADETKWPRHVKPIFAQASGSIPYVREFRELYPDATMGFFERGDGLYLYLVTGLYQRYLVSMDIPITLTSDRCAIADWKEPSFELEDVGEIIVAKDDQGYTTEGSSKEEIDYNHFKILKDHGGDFSAIETKVSRDDPCNDFDRVWRPGHPDYVLRKTTFSPSKRYGVQQPIVYFDGTDDDDDRKNRVVEVGSGRVVAVIDASAGYDRRLNFHEVAPPRWAPDESLLLWKVSGKWNPDALVLVKIHGGREVWQLNLLVTAQQALLRRTKAAAPKKYRAEKKANAGNGSAFPDGFTVDVTPDGGDGEPVNLPLNVQVDLTANPKIDNGYPRILQSHLDGVVTRKGKFVVKDFHLGP